MQCFTTSKVPSSKQFQHWQRFLREVYYDMEVKCDRPELRGRLSFIDVGSTSISRFVSDSHRCFRTSERVRMAPDDSYVIVFPISGDLYFDQAGRQGVVRNGGYVMVSSSQFYELSCSSGFINLTIKIPGEKLRVDCPNIDDHTSLRFHNNAN